MCKSIDDGGQRCASHTRKAEKKARKNLVRARKYGSKTEIQQSEQQWFMAATAYASTDEGAEALSRSSEILFADGHLTESIQVDRAVFHGGQLREANRVAADMIREARAEQERHRHAQNEADRAMWALADAWT